MIISTEVVKALSKSQYPIMKKALSKAGIKMKLPNIKGLSFLKKPSVVNILNGESLKVAIPLREEQDKGVCSIGQA